MRIVLLEFLLKFPSNNVFQLFLDVLLNFTTEKLKIARIELPFKIKVVYMRASSSSIISAFLKVKKP